jgi:GTPase involved in cell partitioning and DNA repair
VRQLGTFIASGGPAGYGKSAFRLHDEPFSPMRGYEGERVTLELELKVLADVV